MERSLFEATIVRPKTSAYRWVSELVGGAVDARMSEVIASARAVSTARQFVREFWRLPEPFSWPFAEGIRLSWTDVALVSEWLVGLDRSEISERISRFPSAAQTDEGGPLVDQLTAFEWCERLFGAPVRYDNVPTLSDDRATLVALRMGPRATSISAEQSISTALEIICFLTSEYPRFDYRQVVSPYAIAIMERLLTHRGLDWRVGY